jgi:hypothetical protein
MLERPRNPWLHFRIGRDDQSRLCDFAWPALQTGFLARSATRPPIDLCKFDISLKTSSDCFTKPAHVANVAHLSRGYTAAAVSGGTNVVGLRCTP